MGKELGNFEESVINKRVELYSKDRVNFSESTDLIMEKIKNGEEISEVDVFTLICDDQKKIDEYTKVVEIRNRAREGKLTAEDLNFLIKSMDINDDNFKSQLSDELGKLI